MKCLKLFVLLICGWASLAGPANGQMTALTVYSDTDGNTALGTSALANVSDAYGCDLCGYFNTASGNSALYFNTTGSSNTASGYFALLYNTTGSNNTASGYGALYLNTGSNNIALGYEAGVNVTTGSDNIEIGNEGATGDNKVIKIGTNQKKTIIAGIYSNTAISGLAVVIGSNGELGTVSSSERFKTAIAPMRSNTAKLLDLRPVTFHYKADPQGTLRYGLIAEEVAKVYPELVVRDEKGRIDGVRYDELAPMLLNETQQQATQIRELKQQVAEMHAALLKLQAKDERVAQR